MHLSLKEPPPPAKDGPVQMGNSFELLDLVGWSVVGALDCCLQLRGPNVSTLKDSSEVLTCLHGSSSEVI